MSERIINTDNSNEVALHTVEPALEAFDAAIDDLSELVPELASIEGLTEASHHVIAEYGINASLFATKERALVFSGIVAKHLRSQSSDGELPAPKAHENMVNMLTVLAHDHSDILDATFKHDDVHSHDLDTQNNVVAYDAYTDRGLTDQLVERIATNGLLDDIKQKLGIDDSNEDPYEIRVMSVAHTDMPTFGLAEDRSELDTEFSMDALERVNTERRDVEAWKSGLQARGVEFAKRLGRIELPADAWVTVLNGTTTLCLASPFAEKLIDPDITNNVSYYSDADRARDRAVLEHEYTHTQGGASVDHDIIGINMEELRAETFSGNKLGYLDTKSFFSEYSMFTGHDIRQELLNRPKGGTNTELYASIANNVGIDSMVDVLFALPNAYAESEQASTFLRDIAQNSGGYDGVLAGLLAKQIKKGDSGVESRIAQAAERIAGIVNKPDSTLDIDGFVSLRKRQGVSIGAELIRDYIVAHYPKTG